MIYTWLYIIIFISHQLALFSNASRHEKTSYFLMFNEFKFVWWNRILLFTIEFDLHVRSCNPVCGPYYHGATFSYKGFHLTSLCPVTWVMKITSKSLILWISGIICLDLCHGHHKHVYVYLLNVMSLYKHQGFYLLLCFQFVDYTIIFLYLTFCYQQCHFDLSGQCLNKWKWQLNFLC